MTEVAAIVRALERDGLLVGVRGQLPATVPAVTEDSRTVVPGGAFVAVRGSLRDGHDFLPDALERGMSLAVVEDAGWSGTPSVVVRASRLAVAVIGAEVHGNPVRSLTMVGVTGTSGKTTVVSMVRHLLDAADAPAASIGTLGVLLGSAGRAFPGGAGLTTPGPLELQRLLRELVDAGVRRVAMEVSSHALDQERVEGVALVAGVFTNLSRDHLDYHRTAEAYLAAKSRLVHYLAPGGAAVVNADAPEWASLPPWPRVVRYGLAAAADVRATGVQADPQGSRWLLAAGGVSAPVELPLIGDFNVSNALAASAAAWAIGEPVHRIALRLGTLPQVPGRLERILDRPVVLRDYAHKPDALERALKAVRLFTARRLILVVGCGGDRDRGKRPLMGAIAERLADVVILTSDNPRTEDPERILDDIERGMSASSHLRVEDRRAAIARALALATTGDVIVLAGKGHETYQVRGTVAHPFDEIAIVRELAGDHL